MNVHNFKSFSTLSIDFFQTKIISTLTNNQKKISMVVFAILSVFLLANLLYSCCKNKITKKLIFNTDPLKKNKLMILPVTDPKPLPASTLATISTVTPALMPKSEIPFTSTTTPTAVPTLIPNPENPLTPATTPIVAPTTSEIDRKPKILMNDDKLKLWSVIFKEKPKEAPLESSKVIFSLQADPKDAENNLKIPVLGFARLKKDEKKSIDQDPMYEVSWRNFNLETGFLERQEGDFRLSSLLFIDKENLISTGVINPKDVDNQTDIEGIENMATTAIDVINGIYHGSAYKISRNIRDMVSLTKKELQTNTDIALIDYFSFLSTLQFIIQHAHTYIISKDDRNAQQLIKAKYASEEFELTYLQWFNFIIQPLQKKLDNRINNALNELPTTIICRATKTIGDAGWKTLEAYHQALVADTTRIQRGEKPKEELIVLFSDEEKDDTTALRLPFEIAKEYIKALPTPHQWAGGQKINLHVWLKDIFDDQIPQEFKDLFSLALKGEITKKHIKALDISELCAFLGMASLCQFPSLIDICEGEIAQRIMIEYKNKEWDEQTKEFIALLASENLKQVLRILKPTSDEPARS